MNKIKVVSIKVPDTPHTLWLNGEYREKLQLLLESYGYVGLSRCHFTTLEAEAWERKLLCLMWENPNIDLQ